MQNIKIFNSREKKRFIEKIKEQYCIKDFDLDYIVLKNNKDRIFLLSNKFKDLDAKNLRINLIGMYFAKLQDNSVRLTIEGSQMIGDKAENVIELNKSEIDKWMRGYDIETDKNFSNFAIIRYNNDFYGTGKVKNGKILNYVPKDRQIKK